MTDEKTLPTLTPPEQLTPPEPVEQVPESSADKMIKIDQSEIVELDERVEDFIDAVVGSDIQTESFQDNVMAIHNMGTKEIRASANVSNRMLNRPVKAMEDGLFDQGSEISKSLVDLRRTVEDLDPSRQGDLLSPQKLLGMIPFGNKVRNYFMKYQSAQGHINAILNSLYRGQDELRKDNAVIEQEKVNMWSLMLQLQKYALMGKKIDEALEAKLVEIEADDPEKARIVRNEMQFYVRQKVQDILTQLAVNIQGYLALDMIRKNNLELIKGVDRATTTTVSALRTAVMVAQALTNQKLVLDQINALNTTTSNMIEATSVMLKQQTADIHEQAASATVNVQQLQLAFDNIYATMDMIDNYKIEALGVMQQTVDTLSGEVERAQTYLDRVRSEEAAQLTGESKINLLELES
jgi:uncharacterized protein YaaN involved in tellurite resistance